MSYAGMIAINDCQNHADTFVIKRWIYIDFILKCKSVVQFLLILELHIAVRPFVGDRVETKQKNFKALNLSPPFFKMELFFWNYHWYRPPSHPSFRRFILQ